MHVSCSEAGTRLCSMGGAELGIARRRAATASSRPTVMKEMTAIDGQAAAEQHEHYRKCAHAMS